MKRLRRCTDRHDSGFSLVELLVAMGIFTVVIAVFLSGLIIMTRSTVRAQDVTNAGDAVRKAFQTMDREIRYASSINMPGLGSPSGSLYVEFVTTNLPDGQDPLCTQWRYDPAARVLQVRTWRDVAASTPSAWSTIATEMRNKLTGPGASVPFVLDVAAGTRIHQQLTVSVDVGRGAAGATETIGADIGTVFVARNSSDKSPSNTDLIVHGVSDSPICLSHLVRP